MVLESRHVAVTIDRSATDVYDYAVDPSHLPTWARGVGASVEFVDDTWFGVSDMGRVAIAFVEANPFGVLDHVVTLPSDEMVYNPMRVIPDGDGSEVVFTVRRRAGTSVDEFERDVEAVQADLAALKDVVEQAYPAA